MTHKVLIDESGYVRCIYNDHIPLHELGKVRLQRLSHITPAFAPIKGPMFRLLRLIFGERGRVASWTRRWRGPWLVKIIKCGEWTMFQERADAVAWEIRHLEECPECKDSW